MATRITGDNTFFGQLLVVSSSSSNTEGRTIVVEQTRLGPIESGIAGAVPDPGASAGLVSIEAYNLGNGTSKYVWTFRSSPDERQAGSSNATERPKPIREISGSTQSQPITLHKNFSKIYNKYGKTMRGGNVEWLDGNPDASSGGGLSKSNASVNPMSGVRNYLKAAAVFSESKFYVSREAVPGDSVAYVGKINNPPGVDGEGDEWIQIGVSITPMGSGYRVDKKWMRDDRGWIKELYS